MPLHTPISTDVTGTITDARGHDIADLWVIDEQGRMRVTDTAQAEMLERAAEIVRRVNMHEELVRSIRLYVEWCEAEETHSVGFCDRMSMCRMAESVARTVLATLEAR